MNIGDIKNLVAGYLKQPASAFIINTEDTLLIAINNARKSAERLRDFYYAQADAYLAVASTGTLLTAATTTSGGMTAISVKRIESVQLQVSDGYIPIEFMRNDEYISRLRKQVGRAVYASGSTKASYGIASENPIAIQQGQTLSLVGGTFTFPINVKLDIVQWMPDYANNTDTDFFVQEGSTYLQWQAMVEGNRYWEQFVARQEGAVQEDSVKEAAQEALGALFAWDDSISKATSSTTLPAPEPPSHALP